MHILYVLFYSYLYLWGVSNLLNFFSVFICLCLVFFVFLWKKIKSGIYIIMMNILVDLFQ